MTFCENCQKLFQENVRVVIKQKTQIEMQVTI